ncbi:hypothetical protein BaRGS_00003080 [Batillaria attramentaria]|uniref:Uncharacterized protein n=1 Tax=Batillaria attramentaria TaxID=370345 RepID=A0ABD0M3B0_9CAEN
MWVDRSDTDGAGWLFIVLRDNGGGKGLEAERGRYLLDQRGPRSVYPLVPASIHSLCMSLFAASVSLDISGLLPSAGLVGSLLGSGGLSQEIIMRPMRLSAPTVSPVIFNSLRRCGQ